ncbi:MAG: LysR family transcriptional regulator [Firmicutes bacterium]|nr:LysR family transcriptional regulator [Bacillota bacterium]MCL5056765.1 LysR family transcriptional regulator [Actinomycetota bacterium]
MDTRQLKAFIAVAGTGSFTKAAEMLDYAQSSITGQVGTLEDELGIKLFERLGRQVLLTREGKRFIEYAEKILKLFSEAKEEVSESLSPRGTLIIGAPETLSAVRLPPLIRQFHSLYPDVEMVVKKCRPKELIDFLKSGQIDVALCLGREMYFPDLVSEILAFEQMVLVSGVGHSITGKIPVTPRDIQGMLLVLCEEGCDYRIAFEKILREAGVHPGQVLEFGSIEAIKKCVIGQFGVTLLPHMAVEGELSRGELVDLQWQGPDFDTNTQVVYHKDKWISPALSAFLKLSREMLGDRVG